MLKLQILLVLITFVPLLCVFLVMMINSELDFSFIVFFFGRLYNHTVKWPDWFDFVVHKEGSF